MMKIARYIFAASVVAALVAGCSKSGGSSIAPYDLSSIGTQTTISTANGGGQAADAVIGNSSSSSTVSNTETSGFAQAIGYLNSYAPALKLDSNKIISKMGAAAAPLSNLLKAPMAAAAPQLAALKAGSLSQAATTSNCSVSGTITVDSTNNIDPNTNLGTASMTLTGNNCVNTSSSLNGTLSFSIDSGSTSGSLTMTTGNGDKVIDSTDLVVGSDPWYTGSISVTDTSSGKIVINASSSGSNTSATDSVSITATSIDQSDDSYWNTTTTTTLDTVTMDMGDTYTSSTDDYSITMNGAITTANGSLGATPSSVGTTAWSLFKIDDKIDWNAYTETTSYNGDFAKQDTPTACGDGVFHVVTNTPIVQDLSTYTYSAGQVTINDNTVVTFASSGVTVSVNGTPVTGNAGSLCTL